MRDFTFLPANAHRSYHRWFPVQFHSVKFNSVNVTYWQGSGLRMMENKESNLKNDNVPSSNTKKKNIFPKKLT